MTLLSHKIGAPSKTVFKLFLCFVESILTHRDDAGADFEESHVVAITRMNWIVRIQISYDIRHVLYCSDRYWLTIHETRGIPVHFCMIPGELFCVVS